MAKKAVTIRDVAREAGVSVATASRALNGMDIVNPQTRDRILTVMMLPFVPCGARLAIFAVFVAAFFPQGGTGFVFAGEKSAGQWHAGEDAEVLLLRDREDFFFGATIESASTIGACMIVDGGVTAR